MYTVKKFKAGEIFETETGMQYGEFSYTACYGVINDSGKVIVRKGYFGKVKTHFYSTKKRAQGTCDAFNGIIK